MGKHAKFKKKPFRIQNFYSTMLHIVALCLLAYRVVDFTIWPNTCTQANVVDSDNVTLRCDWHLHCLTVSCLLSDSSVATCTCKPRPLSWATCWWTSAVTLTDCPLQCLVKLCVWTTRCSDWLCPAVWATLSRTQLTALQDGGMGSCWWWWRMGSGHNGPLPTSRSNDDDNDVC